MNEKNKFKKYELAGIEAERVLESEKSKEKFFELVKKLKVLLKAILPDERANEYLKQILVISIIAQQIAEIFSPRTEEEKYEEKRKIEKTTLENLKSAVKKKIKELIQQNPTRSGYCDDLCVHFYENYPSSELHLSC